MMPIPTSMSATAPPPTMVLVAMVSSFAVKVGSTVMQVVVILPVGCSEHPHFVVAPQSDSVAAFSVRTAPLFRKSLSVSSTNWSSTIRLML